MRRTLLTSDKTGLPNKRAFEEGDASPFVAMSDIDGLKTMNDTHGYAAGDTLIHTFAEVLLKVGLDAYHDKGDEFLCKKFVQRAEHKTVSGTTTYAYAKVGC